jgi:hypothetical protein
MIVASGIEFENKEIAKNAIIAQLEAIKNAEITEEEFESAVNVILAAFFRNIRVDKGRPRERRLDVPENLKGDVHCSLALLKNAINYRTLVDRFQLEITGRGLIYILVGGYDE